ncbi:DUF6538 domain-containing protein [Sphingobium lactosutens]|nr:DUF6538 domain-containing protein [Sphingobium lactosutens]
MGTICSQHVENAGGPSEDGPPTRICYTKLLHNHGPGPASIPQNTGKNGRRCCYTKLLHNRPSGLIIRQGRYYLRRRVPRDLREPMGRAEIWRSLDTDSLQIARRRLPAAAARLELMFEDARSKGGKDIDLTLLKPLDADLPDISPRAIIAPKDEEAPPPGVTIGEAYERYLSDPTHQWSARTRETYDTVRKLAVSVIGAGTEMRSLSRSHMRHLMEVLRYLPRNATKLFPDLSPEQASTRLKETGKGVPISVANANVYLSSLSSFLNWAVDEELADRNPVRGLRFADSTAKKDKRNPFSPEQLRLIFRAPLYTGCKDGDRGYATPGHERPQNARYWVPLIALHSGMRLNEICQLDTADVRMIDGVSCMVVTTESLVGSTDKQLKTGASERLIPIHQRLLDLGLMTYVAQKRRAGEAKLFADIDPGTKGVRAVAFSKWFTQFLTSIGARREKTCFHSLRHCFRDELRHARIDHDLAMALGGWTTGPSAHGKVSENYGRGHRIEVLAEAVNKLTFADVDLSHLGR